MDWEINHLFLFTINICFSIKAFQNRMRSCMWHSYDCYVSKGWQGDMRDWLHILLWPCEHFSIGIILTYQSESCGRLLYFHILHELSGALIIVFEVKLYPMYKWEGSLTKHYCAYTALNNGESMGRPPDGASTRWVEGELLIQGGGSGGGGGSPCIVTDRRIYKPSPSPRPMPQSRSSRSCSCAATVMGVIA